MAIKDELDKLNKKKKVEKIILFFAGTLVIGAYFTISLVFGKLDFGSVFGALNTPEPTLEPNCDIANRIASAHGVSITTGKNNASLSFESKADGAHTVVVCYMKSEFICMRIVRDMSANNKPKDTEEPDGFSDIGGDTQDETDDINGISQNAAYETARLLSYLDDLDSSGLGKRISSELNGLSLDKDFSSSLVSGIYLIEFKYKSESSLLTVTCEPV